MAYGLCLLSRLCCEVVYSVCLFVSQWHPIRRSSPAPPTTTATHDFMILIKH